MINYLGKRASVEFDEGSKKLLFVYVVTLRGLYLLNQKNHWESQSYADHLLFQRLYENIAETADDAAERVVGLCGALELGTMETQVTTRFESENKDIKSLLESSLAAENGYQSMTKKVYDSLKEKGSMTLGLDDLLMGQASEGEVRIYLLQQALKGLEG